MTLVRTAWTISVNELRRLRSHKEIVVFGLALPAIIISLVGLTFGTTGSIDLGVLDRDGSARSASLVERFRDVDGVTLEVYDDEDELRTDVRTTAIGAGLLIPAGYADDLAAGHADVEVVVDPNAEGVASALATIQGAVDEQGVDEAAVAAVADATGDEPRAREVVTGLAPSVAPVEVHELDVLGADVETGSFSHTAPGNLVLFVFINTFVISTILAYDRKAGIIGRLLSTPTPPASVLAGLGLSKLAFALVQSAVLVSVGSVAFGVVWGDPVAAVALTVTFAVLSTAVGLLVGSWVRDAEQAQAIGIPLSVGLGMLGGCMWPLDIVPRPMQIIGHLTPHAWTMDAWVELIFEGGSITAILPNLAVLAGMALLVTPFAVRKLRQSVTG
ncbi:MAG TPA: ABC transporter permease [Acidimicrobiales bacterium]|nr:ABC transporter permease [Acidimicrobiales bacterium]